MREKLTGIEQREGRDWRGVVGYGGLGGEVVRSKGGEPMEGGC